MRGRGGEEEEGGGPPRPEEEARELDEEDDGVERSVVAAGRRSETSAEDWHREEEERKRKALLPMVNGRPVDADVEKASSSSYNSFRKYGKIVSAGGSAAAAAAAAIEKRREEEEEEEEEERLWGERGEGMTHSSTSSFYAGGINGDAAIAGPGRSSGDGVYNSRILGAAGAMLSAQSSDAAFPSEMTADDDDGEGWVTSIGDIRAMKAAGSLDPKVGPAATPSHAPSRANDGGAPPLHRRAACATTDFAMQNVILQMNLELVSVDGARVRRLKTWVTRCGACFTVYHGNKEREKAGGRMFCDKCGSNMMQRVACSVDRGTGRLKLHLKRNYRVNTRGTKFSLPKPGKVREHVVPHDDID